MFGWVDFRGRMENIRRKSFPLFGNEGKIGGSGKLGRKFSPWAHKIFPPKSRGKAMRENCTEAALP